MRHVTGTAQARIQSFHLDEIRLTSIQGFRELKIDLRTPHGPRRRTLIIGKNGTCKSTLLRAIALGVARSAEANRLLGEPLGSVLKKEADRGEIVLSFADSIFSLALGILRQGDREVAELKDNNPKTLPAELYEDWDFFVCGMAPAGSGREPTRARAIGSRRPSRPCSATTSLWPIPS
jgi:hypothetical protein